MAQIRKPKTLEEYWEIILEIDNLYWQREMEKKREAAKDSGGNSRKSSSKKGSSNPSSNNTNGKEKPQKILEVIAENLRPRRDPPTLPLITLTSPTLLPLTNLALPDKIISPALLADLARKLPMQTNSDWMGRLHRKRKIEGRSTIFVLFVVESISLRIVISIRLEMLRAVHWK
jgi:hypothetical protein